MPSPINTHLVEVRYKPNSKVLDYRGAWAEAISKVMELEDWRIDTNRIDVKDKQSLHHAFVSFKNAGFSVANTPTPSYFPDHALKFLNTLFQLEGFEAEPFIERVGLRSRFCTPFDGSFKDLLERYSTRFVLLTEPAKEALEGKLLDIGSPLVLEDENGKINLMGGPMVDAQIAEFFSLKKETEVEPPEVGLTFDIDYWSQPKRIMTDGELKTLVKKYANSCWSMCERLNKLVLG